MSNPHRVQRILDLLRRGVPPLLENFIHTLAEDRQGNFDADATVDSLLSAAILTHALTSLSNGTVGTLASGENRRVLVWARDMVANTLRRATRTEIITAIYAARSKVKAASLPVLDDLDALFLRAGVNVGSLNAGGWENAISILKQIQTLLVKNPDVAAAVLGSHRSAITSYAWDAADAPGWYKVALQAKSLSKFPQLHRLGEFAAKAGATDKVKGAATVAAKASILPKLPTSNIPKDATPQSHPNAFADTKKGEEPIRLRIPIPLALYKKGAKKAADDAEGGYYINPKWTPKKAVTSWYARIAADDLGQSRDLYIYAAKYYQARPEQNEKRVKDFIAKKAPMMQAVRSDLDSDDPKKQLLALMLTIQNAGGFRIGTRKTESGERFGLSKLRVRDVYFKGDQPVFTYVGKFGKTNTVGPLNIPSKAAKLLKQLMANRGGDEYLFASSKQGRSVGQFDPSTGRTPSQYGGKSFVRPDEDDVNAYMRDKGAPKKASFHLFRHAKVTKMMQDFMAQAPSTMTPQQALQYLLRGLKQAATALGHSDENLNTILVYAQSSEVKKIAKKFKFTMPTRISKKMIEDA